MKIQRIPVWRPAQISPAEAEAAREIALARLRQAMELLRAREESLARNQHQWSTWASDRREQQRQANTPSPRSGNNILLAAQQTADTFGRT